METKMNSITLNQVFFDPNNNLLQKGDIHKTVTCIRPGNKQLIPKVFAEKIKSKTIINNYGHYGIGWTVGWGSVFHAVEIFEKTNTINKNELVSIIGAGIIGIATAIILLEKGYTNIEIVADNFENTTSHNSGAYFGLIEVSEETKSNLLYKKFIIDSYLTWKEIHDRKLFGITRGVKLVDIYLGAHNDVGPQESNIGNEILIENKLIEENQLVNITYDNKSFFRMKKNKTFYFNTYEIIEEMYNILKRNNVLFRKKTIISLDEEGTDLGNVVFNCTGLGSRELNIDSDIYPIAGHLLLMNNQDTNIVNYVIFCKYLLPEDLSTKQYRSFYYMPKNCNGITGILGGSYVEGYSGDNEEINNKYFKAILRMAQHFFSLDFVQHILYN
jgi:D-amino-acid oxidase